jgi:hypothetical protein
MLSLSCVLTRVLNRGIKRALGLDRRLPFSGLWGGQGGMQAQSPRVSRHRLMGGPRSVRRVGAINHHP